MPTDGGNDPQLQTTPEAGHRKAGAIVLVALAAAWLVLASWIDGTYVRYREAQQHGQVSALAASSAGALSNALNQRLAQVRGLAAFVSVKLTEGTPGELEREFPIFASAYYQQVTGIRNISVAPDFVVELVYPQDPGNRKVIGNRLREDKRPGFAEAVNRAIETRDIVVHEPVEMIQGGRGLLARHAVFVNDRPWGAVGMVFTLSTLFETSHLPSLASHAWGVRTAAGAMVGGDPAVFSMQPVTVRIGLPDGHWEFALVPIGGWAELAGRGAEVTALRLGLAIIGAGLLGLAWEIIRRRHILKYLVNLRTRELLAANRELERFSFVVAHDLQEPLRSIMSFSQLVERGLGTQMTVEQRQWLDGLGTSARLMRALLHDVQVYLGETDAPLPRREIPADEALAIARRKLRARLEQSGATIEATPLPMVWADHHRLSEVLAALIGNALEYRSPDRTPLVRVSSRAEGDFEIIDVSDNGIGIEEIYFERIFEVFRRLHSRTAHPGTGMGLAIAKKMVEHLGGTIRVRSTVDEGSTFSIALPKVSARAAKARWERM